MCGHDILRMSVQTAREYSREADTNCSVGYNALISNTASVYEANTRRGVIT